MTTAFEDKTSILADLWLNYRYDTEFVDFIEYNDLGLPLAYAINEGIVDTTDLATNFINETFDLLLAGLGIQDSEDGFPNLSELLGQD
jgi:hypothetical protein